MSINRFEVQGILTAKQFRKNDAGRDYVVFQVVTEYLYHSLDTGKAEYSKDILDFIGYRPYVIDRLRRIQKASWIYIFGRLAQARTFGDKVARLGVPYLVVANVMQMMAPHPDQVTDLPMVDPDKDLPHFTRRRMMKYLQWIEDHPDWEKEPNQQGITPLADGAEPAASADNEEHPFALPDLSSGRVEPRRKELPPFGSAPDSDSEDPARGTNGGS